MNIAALIIIALLLISLAGPTSFLIYLVFILPVFGSLSLLPPEAVGGASVMPAAIATLLLILKALTLPNVRKSGLRSALDFNQMGFLSLYLIVAIIGAFVLPRLFEGEIMVFTMKSQYLAPVTPSMYNFTQSVYLGIAVLSSIAFSAFMRNPAFVDILLKALLAGAFAIIATGLLDIAASFAGLPEVTAYFRTASYAFMTDNYVAGARRVIGLMTEASAYGSGAASSCALLLFLRPVYAARLRRLYVPAAAWGCGLMALLSTSSTAYVMMAITCALYAFYTVKKVEPDGKIVKKAIAAKLFMLAVGGILALLLALLNRGALSSVSDLLDIIIFKKQSSSSYIERSSWTSSALDAFFSSGGLGIGVGSVRTSNFFVNVIASTGIPGGMLFALFLWKLFTRRAPEADSRARVMIRAAKLALIPIFAGASLAGTTPDSGMAALHFGLIMGLGQLRGKHTQGVASFPASLARHTP